MMSLGKIALAFVMGAISLGLMGCSVVSCIAGIAEVGVKHHDCICNATDPNCPNKTNATNVSQCQCLGKYIADLEHLKTTSCKEQKEAAQKLIDEEKKYMMSNFSCNMSNH